MIARNSSFVYKGRSVDVREAAKQLGVRHILVGSVRKSGNRFRASVQLIDAKDGAHVWAERYDRSIEDIFAIQDEITLILATEMQVRLTEGEQARLRTRPPAMLRPGPIGSKGCLTTTKRSPKKTRVLRGFVGKRHLRSIPRQRRSTPCWPSFTVTTPASAGGRTAKRQSSRRILTPTVRLNSIRAMPMVTLRWVYYVG